MKETETINIIGGGISGLTTALGLQTSGIKYKIYEQKPEITYDNVGLGISANIFHILEEWNILKETKEIGSEIQNFHFVDKTLRYIKSFTIEKPALSVNRKLFYQILIERLKKQNIYLNCAKSIDDFSKNEIIISADGINSNTRQKFYPNLKLRDSNQILWRGISEIKLDKKFQNAYHDFVGGNLRFAIIHTGKNYYSWYIVKEKNDKEGISYDKEVLKAFFKSYHPIINKVIDKSSDVYFSELLDINPQKRKNLPWFKDNTLMIGDAIHPTTPNMANGACLAIEDSYLLTNLLGKKELTLQEAFEIVQKKRTNKVDTVVFQSYWIGKLMHQNNKIIDGLTLIGMSLTPQFLFNKIYSNVLKETRIDNKNT